MCSVRRWSRRDLVILALPLVVGALLRLTGLGHQGLFLDEAFSLDLALRPWGEMLQLALRDTHPPLLYYPLLKLSVDSFGRGEWAARLPSALCSTAALALATMLTYRRAGLWAAWGLGWLLALSSLSLYYAQEARMYALFELLWLPAPWLLLHALAVGAAWRWWLFWALATAAAVHVQFFGGMLWALGALLALGVLVVQQRWQSLWRWLGAQLVVAALVAPMALQLFATVRRGVGGTWLPAASDVRDTTALMLFGFTPARHQFLNGDALAPWPWVALPPFAWGLLVVVALLGTLGGALRAPRGQARALCWLGLSLGAGTLLATWALLRLANQPLWGQRLFVGATLWLLVAVAIGWAALPRPLAVAGLLLALLLNLGPVWAYRAVWVKDYGRVAVARWQATAPPNTPLVLDRVASGFVWRYYLPEQNRPPIYGLDPQPDGSFVLRRLLDNGTLRGTNESASCNELQGSVGLYDPAARRLAEVERWPVCLREASGWRWTNPGPQWQAVPQLAP